MISAVYELLSLREIAAYEISLDFGLVKDCVTSLPLYERKEDIRSLNVHTDLSTAVAISTREADRRRERRYRALPKRLTCASRHGLHLEAP